MLVLCLGKKQVKHFYARANVRSLLRRQNPHHGNLYISGVKETDRLEKPCRSVFYQKYEPEKGKKKLPKTELGILVRTNHTLCPRDGF